MLHIPTINAVLPLATKVTNKQFVLSAVEGTPLSVLVDSGYSPSLDITESDIVSMIHEASTEVDATGENLHNGQMSELITLVGDSVQRTLNGARNLAGPIFRKVAEDVQEIVEQERVKLLNPIKIEPLYYHRVWSSPVLEGLAGRYSEQPVLDVTLPATLPDMTPEAVTGYLRVGNSSFDEGVEELLTTKSDNWLMGLYVNIFTAKGRGYDELRDIMTGKHVTRDELLCTHLLARRLLQDPPEGIHQGLNDYRTAMSSVVNQTGRAVARLMQLRQREYDKKLLVYGYSNKNPEKVSRDGAIIRVNGELYNRWIDDGGTPETLNGALFDGGDTTYDGLLEKREVYERLWERQRRLIAMRVSYQEKVVKLSAYQAAMTVAINALGDDAMVMERSVYHERLKYEMRCVNENQLDNFYQLSRQLVCRVIFPHTDYEKVLVTIDRCCEEYPEMEVREAALLATVEYIVDWIAQFIVTSKEGSVHA